LTTLLHAWTIRFGWRNVCDCEARWASRVPGSRQIKPASHDWLSLNRVVSNIRKLKDYHNNFVAKQKVSICCRLCRCLCCCFDLSSHPLFDCWYLLPFNGQRIRTCESKTPQRSVVVESNRSCMFQTASWSVRIAKLNQITLLLSSVLKILCFDGQSIHTGAKRIGKTSYGGQDRLKKIELWNGNSIHRNNWQTNKSREKSNCNAYNGPKPELWNRKSAKSSHRTQPKPWRKTTRDPFLSPTWKRKQAGWRSFESGLYPTQTLGKNSSCFIRRMARIFFIEYGPYQGENGNSQCTSQTSKCFTWWRRECEQNVRRRTKPTRNALFTPPTQKTGSWVSPPWQVHHLKKGIRKGKGQVTSWYHDLPLDVGEHY